MYRLHKKAQRGFTLIELLVVIAIIGMLSSIVLASLGNARREARDARRIADLKQLQIALALHYSGANAYPIRATVNTTKAEFDATLAPIVPTHISVIPSDPSGGTNTYYYRTTASGSYYCLGAIMETTPLPVSFCITGATGLNGLMTGGGNYIIGP